MSRPLEQVAGGDLGDVGVKGGQHPIEGLDHGDLAAQRGVRVGELQADVTACQ
jgi:hypothetical protein